MITQRSSPDAIKDVDKDEEECDEHCHPESDTKFLFHVHKILWKIVSESAFIFTMKLLSFCINAADFWESLLFLDALPSLRPIMDIN